MSSAPTFDPEDPLDFTELAQAVEALPRPLAVAFALRCALRVLPLTAPGGRFPESWNWEQSVTPIRVCFFALGWLMGATPKERLRHLLGSIRRTDQAANAAADTITAIVHAVSKADSRNDAYITLEPSLISRVMQLFSPDERSDIENELARLARDAGRLRGFGEKPEGYVHYLSIVLWPRNDRETLARIGVWSDALVERARSKSAPTFAITEAHRLLRGYDSLVHGRPDWKAIIGPAHEAKVIEHLPDPFSPPPLPLSAHEWPLLLARLAYRNPATLALAEAPAPGAFERLVSPEERRDLPGLAATLARETGDFSPDPLWLAWIQAAHPAFFAAVTPGAESAPRPPITESAPTPPEPPPSSSSSPPPLPPARSAASKRKK